jgi:phospholipid/cholesterol/gamma-HCH transport system substrate-binding protein
MQQTRAVEIGTGLFVFLGFAALLFLSTQTTNLEAYIGTNFYTVTAHFNNVGGLKPRSPVSMAGVTIGRVEKIEFDPERLDAVVTINFSGKYDRIPDDSDASILTAGLLGGQYVGLQAGGSDRYLQNGDEIMFTQSAVVLENLISKYLFSGGSQASKDDEDAGAAPRARGAAEAPVEAGGTDAPVTDRPAALAEPEESEELDEPERLDELDELDGLDETEGLDETDEQVPPRDLSGDADNTLPDAAQGSEENQ